MAVYCVSYDLHKSGQNYASLHEELRNSPGYIHLLDSTWLISTSESAYQLSERIKRCVDDNDLFLVIKVAADYAGWLPEESWVWLKNHL